MKALSLRQPWAHAVVHLGKHIENRRWPTRFRGEFFIHAAKGMTRHEYEDAVCFIHEAAGIVVANMVPAHDELDRGGIIGRARLVDVIPPCLPDFPCDRAWHMHDQYGFVLEGVEALPFVPCIGMLGFFDVNADGSSIPSTKPPSGPPTCPECKTPAVMLVANHHRGMEISPKHTVICAACGHYWAGTAEEVDRATKADAAWERKSAKVVKTTVRAEKHAALERRLAELKKTATR